MATLRFKWLRARLLWRSSHGDWLFPPAMNSASWPLPQPWVTEPMEDKYQHTNDYRTPIMPPIRTASRPRSARTRRATQEVLRAMPRVPRGVPYFYEDVPRRHPDRQRTARGQDRPAAVLPAGRPGPAAPLPLGVHDLLHRDVSRATRSRSSVKQAAVQVIYIDKDHLHLYVGPEPGDAGRRHAGRGRVLENRHETRDTRHERRQGSRGKLPYLPVFSRVPCPVSRDFFPP